MKNERRYFERVPVKLPILMRAKSESKVFEAQMQDLGAKGLGITAKDRIPAEGEVNLRVEIPGKPEYLNLAGNVVWAREYFPNGWRAGIGLKEQSINLVTFSVLLDKYR
jgi:Tfp pilus assembly protein PilZ